MTFTDIFGLEVKNRSEMVCGIALDFLWFHASNNNFATEYCVGSSFEDVNALDTTSSTSKLF